MAVEVREATPEDRLGVRRVLDAAMLDVREDLGERISDGNVLIATADDSSSLLGALVLVPHDGDARDAEDESSARVDAVAVRRARRAQGIGSSLVRAASERHQQLTAEFDASVRPFYESLGFEIESVEEGGKGADRFRGRYERGVA